MFCQVTPFASVASTQPTPCTQVSQPGLFACATYYLLPITYYLLPITYYKRVKKCFASRIRP
ncbi:MULTISPECIES: hypothetical protein [unclassified Moorena]|uniref:hypothetical protein n=1 Tax=unclassified Moorena TaxID=2683338 RepID=UPI0013C1AF8E|nr:MULTISPECIES: hypothetical protein [unclassified Moorena]NEO07235.1 hypothetical protein [Moorena sp. SIO3I8]NEO19862.1 hypothetical protein [Moorena sp. SIO4A5]NEQ57071.1 hypothetical protein [Moorena sp. SIO4A1]